MVHTADRRVDLVQLRALPALGGRDQGLVDGIQHGIPGLLVDQTVESLASGSRH
jgi:hypothetical protein